MARTARIKQESACVAYYHLMSRTNNKVFLFHDAHMRDRLVAALQRAATFSGGGTAFLRGHVQPLPRRCAHRPHRGVCPRRGTRPARRRSEGFGRGRGSFGALVTPPQSGRFRPPRRGDDEAPPADERYLGVHENFQGNGEYPLQKGK